MELIVELKDINFQNNYNVYYRLGDTPGPSTHINGFIRLNGTYTPQINQLTINMFNIDNNPYGKQFWFKIVDSVTQDYIIKNIYIHEKIFYDMVCEPIPEPTPSPTPEPIPEPTPSPTPEPNENEFNNQPIGVEGTVFVTGSTYTFFLQGFPFTMSPNPANQNSDPGGCSGCNAKINFINNTSSLDSISFTLGGTASATAFTNLQIRDNLGTTYTATFQNGENNIDTGSNKIISFNIGTQKGRIFRFVGGEINLQFS